MPRGVERFLGSADPVQQGREVGMTERDPLDPTESFGDGHPSTERRDPPIDVPGHGLCPAEDASSQRLLR